MRTKHKFVVLGGGISGLIASHYLKGEDHIILEKDDVLGGATARPSGLGGIRILPEGENSRELLKDFNLPVYECKYTIGVHIKDRMVNLLKVARQHDMITILNDYCRKTRKQSYYDIPDEERESVMSGIQKKVHKYSFSMPYLGGIEYLFEHLVNEAQNKAFLGAKVESIKDKALILDDGSIIDWDYLITTIPMNAFLEMMGTPINLASVPIRFLNITLEDPKSMPILDDGAAPLYIYFPGLNIPFHRMSFPNRFSSLGGGVKELLIETTELDMNKNDNIWDILVRLGILGHSENTVVAEYTQNIGHFSYTEGAQAITKELEDFDVYCLGRYAEWSHNSNIEAVIGRAKEVANGIRVANKPKSHA